MSAWILPDHIADVLPSEARHIEELRRGLLDTACAYGYELVMPPLLEHLDSLLSGSGEALDLLTFKLVDQLSGRTLGIRPDTTQQVARIDAHLLNRKGVTRLCYCGPVLHAKPDRPHATREPLQFGAEIYGHAGVEADVEVIALATQSLRVAQLHDFSVDLADVRIVQRLLAGLLVDLPTLRRVHAALAVKDASELASLTRDFPQAQRDGLRALLQLYGDVEVLAEAEKALAAIPGVAPILADLRQLASRIDSPAVTFDLADLRGYSYYSGMRFAIYAQGVTDALVRGGRYDEVGAAFGRSRPAVGFSLDIKQLVPVVEPRPLKAAIRAPWVDRHDMREVIARLRQTGETVVCALPGHDDEVDEFNCDRELAEVDGQWIVRSI
ncbi:ATP phosphoribosyltransferase regulatory subunit [Comamonas sp.]|uniref:ATP phosphoribosyltransferase regulatory subunit n=1 Tax=Comamonas sp. TaxID=34028 RepID=UPI0028A71DEF|nr:ATP phosphoribosyltransferase regulatory subunit [Comamonas sp.]